MMQLDPRASAAGVRLVSHEVLTSTNAEAFALARAGERGPLWITAGQQTSGRGRRGRSWTSAAGNLFATLMLTSPGSPDHWPELSFVAALAIHDSVAELAPSLKPRLAIKWPNDLLLGGSKFAGILIEGEPAGDGTGAVAVGIGVNCVSHPRDTEFPATDLSAEGADVSPEGLFAVLSAKMLGRLAQWNDGEHFSTVRADWLARAAGLGETLRVRLTDHEIAGRFETIDDAGRLVLARSDGGTESVATGDVILLEAPGLSSPRASSGQG